MNFELRVWTARFEEGDSVLSQLAVDVHAALIAAHPVSDPVDLDQVETNFVQIDVGPDRAGAIERMREHGVLVSTTVHPTVVRAVTHLDISDDDIDATIGAIPAALGATRTEVPLER